MSFKLSESYFEVSCGDETYPAEDSDSSYTNRRVRAVLGHPCFFFAVVDDYTRIVRVEGSTIGPLVREPRFRFTGPSHDYQPVYDYRHELHGVEQLIAWTETSAREALHWVRTGDLKGAGAERAVYNAFYVLEIAPALRAGKSHWLAEWAPKWWSMFEGLFGDVERKVVGQ